MKVSRRRRAVVVLAAVAGLLGSGLSAAQAQQPKWPGTNYTFTSAGLDKGLYQSAYSYRNNVLWVTASTGRPPVTETALLKVDPRTMKVLAKFTPPVTDPATGAKEAVYGVDVDDRNNTVWVTNTRNDGVAVYDQATGAHLTSLPEVPHARDVVVDEFSNRAYASAFGGGYIEVFDAAAKKPVHRVQTEGSTPIGMRYDPVSGNLYAADLKTGDVLVVDTRNNYQLRRFPTGATGSIAVDVNALRGEVYVAAQGSGTLTVLDSRTGAVRRTVPTGAGALTVASDVFTGRVFVGNRGAGTVSVVDPANGTVLATLATGPNPNHLAVVFDRVYLVDKSRAGQDGVDLIHKITAG